VSKKKVISKSPEETEVKKVKTDVQQEILANSKATLECIQELTKTVAELVAEWSKWSAAGKF